jgi:hypothetical protein
MKLLQTLFWVSAGVAGLALLGCAHSHRPPPSEPVYVAQPQPQPEYVIVREAPPAFIVERRPSPPSGEYIWIDGFWHWNDRQYVWQAGYWARPPHEHFIWVAPRYERHEQGYRYTPGQWREDAAGTAKRWRACGSAVRRQVSWNASTRSPAAGQYGKGRRHASRLSA